MYLYMCVCVLYNIRGTYRYLKQFGFFISHNGGFAGYVDARSINIKTLRILFY